MKVKNVVKVMNFHSLLRVDKARKDAEKYFEVEKQLRNMIDSITNNRNIILDKNILRNTSGRPVLNIYIGSDLGFVVHTTMFVTTKLKMMIQKRLLLARRLERI